VRKRLYHTRANPYARKRAGAYRTAKNVDFFYICARAFQAFVCHGRKRLGMSSFIVYVYFGQYTLILQHGGRAYVARRFNR
jgi:hypothetical protein